MSLILLQARADSMSVSPTPRDFTLAKEGDDGSGGPSEQTGDEQFLAADYDPSLDRREDERKRFGDQPIEVLEEDEEEEIEEIEEEEDIDDMFSVALDKPKVRKVKKVKVSVIWFSLSRVELTCTSRNRAHLRL